MYKTRKSSRVVRCLSALVFVLHIAGATAYAATTTKAAPWIDARDYSSLSQAIEAAGSGEKTILVGTPQRISSDLTVPENVCLWFVKGGCLEIAKNATVVIKGNMEAGLYRVFKGDGTVRFGSREDPGLYRHASGNIKEVYAEWWGAVADSKTDCTQALQKALDAADFWRTLRLVDGRYAITSTLKVHCPISGNSPNNSVIWNKGSGDCLFIVSMSYKQWRDFGVEGNPKSRDGIVLCDPAKEPPGGYAGVTYSSFINVWSYNNGRHGLYARSSWGTGYVECRFTYNGGLGAYLDTPGNGVSLLNCHASWNGRDDANLTFNDDVGGVKIVGPAAVSIEGGVYESNNAWGFIMIGGGWSGNANIKNIYMENTPRNASKVKEGGFFYVEGSLQHVTVEQSWLGYGAVPGSVGYCFYVDRKNEAGRGRFIERDNTAFAGPGTTPASAVRYHGTTYDKPEVLISEFFGDLDNANKPTRTTILKASKGGRWTVSGSILVTVGGAKDPSGTVYVGQEGMGQETIAAVYPFIATCDGIRTACNVGNPTVGALQKPPKVSFNKDELQVELPGYHTAFVKIEEQVLARQEPKFFDFSGELFGGELEPFLGGKIGQMMRRR